LAHAIVESAQKRLLAMWLHVSQSVASASTQQRSAPDMRVTDFAFSSFVRQGRPAREEF
jgi:hypothetical protein